MDKYLVELIARRMRQLGFDDDYTLSAVRIAGNDSVTFSSQNEYHYLVASTVPATMTIQSESDVMLPAESALYSTQIFSCIREFTGSFISIEKGGAGGAFDVEFVKVIPSIKKTKDISDFLLAQTKLIHERFKQLEKE